MFELGISKGTWFYIASFVNDWEESGISVIICGLRVSWLDQPANPNRREWVIPRNAWNGKVA